MPRRFPGGSRPSAFTPRRSSSRAPATPAGLNVYVVEVAKRLAPARRRGGDLHPRGLPGRPARGRAGARGAGQERAGWAVRGARQELDLPAQLCHVHLRACCAPRPPTRPAGTTWCTGTTGCPATSARSRRSAGACRWCSPCTPWARSRTLALAQRRRRRARGQDRGARPRSVAAADRLVANTDEEARQLVGLYGADPARDLDRSTPGCDLSVFRPVRRCSRGSGGGSACPPTGTSSVFAGRIQPLKAPDVALRAAAIAGPRRPGAGASR